MEFPLGHGSAQTLEPRTPPDRVGCCPQGFVSFDRSLRVIHANAMAVETLRAQRKAHGEIVLDENGALLDHARQALATGEPVRFENRRGDRLIDIHIHPVPEGLDVFLKCVEDGAGLEAALKAEVESRRLIEQRFETALSVNPMVVFNLNRDMTYTWVYNNQIRLRDEEAKGRTPADFFDAETVPSLLAFFRSVVDSGQAGRAELSLRPIAMREMRHYISSAKPMFSDSGEVVGLTGASIDITDIVRQRQELERARKEALLAKAEAERANLSKSKFLAAASHDLRQPAQSLFLLQAVLEGRNRAPEPDHLVEKMGVALDGLRLLLDSMLDISKLDAGVIVPKFEAVAVGGILGRLAREYRLRAEEVGLDFRFAGTTLWTWSDASLIERALRNLLENAIRYTPHGKILLGCRRRGGQVRIDVVDTGIGIAAEDRELVFEEFQQVHNTARDRTQGLGLGLAIVCRLVRLLGGTVELESGLGRGSRFSLCLPTVPAIGVTAAAFQGAIDGAGRRVLLVEDDAVLRDSLDMLFRHWFFTSRTAETADAALDVVRDGFRPALIVGDYRLKGNVNGIETVRRIRDHLGYAVPSLIITGDTAPERIREVLGSGLRILHKPVTAEDLLRELRQMVRDGDLFQIG